jgi:MoaA/NifB/PqqE/SkfB family radical SAM enzyme
MNNELTIFVISAGKNPNFNDCIKALEAQTLLCKIDIIKDYAPMSRAFQEMMNRCQTKYYIQVDEDMILQPTAVQTMYEAIQQVPAKVCMVAHTLHDPHLAMDIVGIKVYKHDIFKNYPYNLEVIACEKEQLNRMEADGYSIQVIEKVMGEHSPKWTNELIFERYFDLMEKYKVYGYLWLEDLPRQLKAKYKGEPSELNYYAMMGAMTSIASPVIHNKEKDFTVKSEHYLKLKSWDAAPKQATLFVTNNCNFTCNFCLRQNPTYTMEMFPDMTVEMVRVLLKRFPSLEGICVCGYGEPLVATNIQAIMTYLHNEKIAVGLITNGSLLKEKLHIIKSAPPSYVSISLNAYDAVSHEQQTGVKGQFEHIIEGIRALVATGIPTYLSYVCSKESIKGIAPFLVLAKSLGVKAVHLHNTLPHLLADESMIQDFLENVVLTVKDKETIDAIRELPCADIIGKYPTLIDPDHPQRNCEAAFNCIAMNGNGSISVCQSIYPPDKANGALFYKKEGQNTLFGQAAWHNEYCEKTRLQFSKTDIPLPCKYCFRNWD